jgi:hypothetical protein
MSAYLINDGHQFRCSKCGDNLILVDHGGGKIRHCWNCGSKFGPEPKAEPTGGDWWYNFHTNRILASPGAVVAEVFTHRTDGYLIAASKKLLAACKVIALTERTRTHLVVFDPKALEQVEAAIADAKPK